MTLAPKPPKAVVCPACKAALPLPSAVRCPTCGADVRKPGDPGSALVDAMMNVLSDPLGKKRKE